MQTLFDHREPQAAPVTQAFQVDAMRGTQNTRVSSQWWSRPDDQRFLSLSELYGATKLAADASRPMNVETANLRVQADHEDIERMEIILPGEEPAQPTHWSFGQLCSLVSAPAGFLRDLPGPIAGIPLQYRLQTYRSELVKTYVREDGTHELRAVTGPDYGRICDHEVVAAVMKLAGNGTGDTRWKVPGMLEGFGRYNPFVDITKETTTLFASDRDVFIFLVDDTHPIEVGTLPDGSPDLLFRGFYVWNSEVGSRSFGIATMYLRGVCMNRILWGVEGFQEITMRHSKNAPDRFMYEARPALESFANADTGRLLTGIKDAKAAVVARKDEDREKFLAGQGFSKAKTKEVIETVMKEEGKAPESIWDFVNGITAVARKTAHQDARLDLEKTAKKLLDKVA